MQIGSQSGPRDADFHIGGLSLNRLLIETVAVTIRNERQDMLVGLRVALCLNLDAKLLHGECLPRLQSCIRRRAITLNGTRWIGWRLEYTDWPRRGCQNRKPNIGGERDETESLSGVQRSMRGGFQIL